MKSILCGFVLAALTSVTFGVTLPFGLTTPVPTTSCGQVAKKCYTDRKTQLDKVMDQFNFPEACPLFKEAIACIDNELGLTTCTGALEQEEMKQMRDWAIHDQDGICNVDGSISQCGTDVQACFDEMSKIMGDLKSANASSACPLIPKFMNCAKNVQARTECTDKVTSALTKIESTFSDYDLLANCQGPCARGIGICTENSTSFSIQEIGAEKYCQDAVKVIGCINNLKSTPQCAGKQDDIKTLESVIQSQQTLMSDVCENGHVSPCATRIVGCVEDLKSVVNDKGDVAAQCEAASVFIQCLADLPCVANLKPAVDKMRQETETAEMQNNCPTVGTCDERVKKCIGNEQDYANKFKNAPNSQSCSIVKAPFACFNNVRKDPVCLDYSAAISDFENTVNKDYQKYCGNGAIVLPSVLLIVASFLASYF